MIQDSLFEGSYRISPVGGLVSPMAEQMLPQSDWCSPTTFPDLSQADVISFDIESRDPNLRKSGPGFVRGDAEAIGVSVATNDGFCAYYPVRHEGGGNLAPNVVFSWLKDVLGSDVPKLGANLLYDIEGLHFEDIKVNGPLIDIQNAEALIEEEKSYASSDGMPTGYSLDALAYKYLGQRKDEAMLKTLQTLLKVKDIKGSLYRLPARFVGPYAEADARLPLLIWAKQKAILKKENLTGAFKLETDLVPLMLAMRLKGVRIDEDAAQKASDELAQVAIRKTQEIKRLSGVDVDIWSNDSLVKLCDRLDLPYRRTASGRPSFVKDWLNEHQHPAFRLIASARKVVKMKRDFIDAAIIKACYKGRLHTQFHALRSDDGGTRSGRFSSSNPPLQQIPARDPVFRKMIRGLFIPEHGTKWGCYDYASQEPRLTIHFAYLAKLAGADVARQRYLDDPRTDYHQMTADMAQIERKPAKTLNLGLMYGMGKRKMSLDLGYMTLEEYEDKSIPVPAATEELFAKYHNFVPYVKGITDLCSNLAQSRGYIKTIMGRRRHFDLYEPARFRSMDGKGRSMALPLGAARLEWPDKPLVRAYTYKAANALIQGSAADMTKKAMLDAYQAGYVPHLTVHDEVDDSIENDKQHQEMHDIMVNAVKLEVPVLVDASLTNNWGEAD